MSRNRKSLPKKATNRFEVEVTEALQSIHYAVHEIDEKRQIFSTTLTSIQELHSNVVLNQELSTSNKCKLQDQYKRALKEAKDEADAIRRCLRKIHQIRQLQSDHHLKSQQVASAAGASPMSSLQTLAPERRSVLLQSLQHSASILPLWIGKLGRAPPPLCGALAARSNHIHKVGDVVAVRIEPTDHELDDHHNWILANVLSYNKDSKNKQYLVEDVDGQPKDRYMVDGGGLIALPQYRACVSTDPDALFPVQSVVLALYPQTTCFYKGVVKEQPVDARADYVIVFDDMSGDKVYCPPMRVPQRYVIAHKRVL